MVHRFRLIDAGAEDCPIEMSIDNHRLWIISLDSNDVQPVLGENKYHSNNTWKIYKEGIKV